MENADLPKRPARWRPLAAVALSVLIVVTGAWLLTSRDAPTSAQTSPDGKIIEEFAPGDRVKVADFDATLLDGTSYASSQTLGTIAVYNVWGSWCGPCRTEAPDLARLARETAPDTSFVGINVRDNDAAARAFERTFDVPYTSITTDDSAQALLAFGATLSSSAIPSTVVVDPEGRVAARVIGPITYSTLKSLVTTVLAEGSSGAS